MQINQKKNNSIKTYDFFEKHILESQKNSFIQNEEKDPKKKYENLEKFSLPFSE